MTLPNELLDALERRARRRHTSVSEVIRGMLAAQLGMLAEAERSLPLANLGRSGQRDVARNMEALLGEGRTP